MDYLRCFLIIYIPNWYLKLVGIIKKAIHPIPSAFSMICNSEIWTWDRHRHSLSYGTWQWGSSDLPGYIFKIDFWFSGFTLNHTSTVLHKNMINNILEYWIFTSEIFKILKKLTISRWWLWPWRFGTIYLLPGVGYFGYSVNPRGWSLYPWIIRPCGPWRSTPAFAWTNKKAAVFFVNGGCTFCGCGEVGEVDFRMEVWWSIFLNTKYVFS